MAAGAQVCADLDEAPFVRREARCRDPAGRRRGRGQDDRVGRQRLARFHDRATRLDRCHPYTRPLPDPGTAKRGRDLPARRIAVSRQNLVHIRDDGELQPVRCHAVLSQPALQRHRELDAACACAHGDKAESAPGPGRPFFQLRPAFEEPVHGLDRQGALRTPDARCGGRGADVQRHDVEGQRRPAVDQRLVPVEVEARHGPVNEPGAGECSQRRQIDVRFRVAVSPCNKTRQHPGIGRGEVACRQSQPHAGDRGHAEAAQHLDMGVSAADQQDIGADRRRRGHHGAGRGRASAASRPRRR